VQSVFLDCDRDSLIYLSEPQGPSCHTGARACWFTQATVSSEGVQTAGDHTDKQHVPRTTLLALEHEIAERGRAAEAGSGRTG